MNMQRLSELYDEIRKYTARLPGTVLELRRAEKALREAKGILRCHEPLKSNEKGQVILDVDQKLDALRYTIVGQLYEDATGHLIDLLFYCANRVVDKEDALSYINQMIARGPVEIKDEVSDV